MTSAHLSGGSAKRMHEEEEENNETNPHKKRRIDIIPVAQDAVKDCVLLTKTNIEWRAALKHLIKCVLDGGVMVKLGQVQLYPGYDEDAEKRLVENLENAVLWRMTLGFVLVIVHRKPIYIHFDDSSDSEDAGLLKDGYKDSIDTNDPNALRRVIDAMEVDDNEKGDKKDEPKGAGVATMQLEEERYIALDKDDLDFIVPSLGYGTFRSFLDLQEYKYKVDYIRTKEEKENEDLACFVYTQEEPVQRVSDSTDESGVVTKTVSVWPSSPAARLIKHARMLDNYMMADEEATKLATYPVPVAQERPPTKDSVALARGSDYGFAGYIGADGRNITSAPANGQHQYGKPHITKSEEKRSSVQELAVLNNKTVEEMRNHTYFIQPGYVYAGLMTPHAYPRISDRRVDYLSLVSTETGVPAHVIVPGKTVSTTESSGMTGSTAGGKEQATGAKQAAGGAGHKKPGSSGFTADPSFNTALDLRDFLQNFFQSIMRVKNGEKLARYMMQEATKVDRERQIKEELVMEFDELIKKAQDAVVQFTTEISDTIGVRHETSHLQAEAHRNAFKPQAIAASNTSADGKSKGPTQLPEPPAEKGSNVPSAPEVEALTQRRLQVVNDMRAISEAVEQQRKMMSMERPVSLMWRQPFVNDTSNIAGVMQLLGLPDEQSHDIAMRRFGLKS